MSFAARTTRHPRPFDTERGSESLALFPDLAPELRGVIEGTGGCSPYLKTLMERETAWIAEAFGDPEAAYAAEMARISEVAPDKVDAELRRAKRRLALLIALADIAGVWTLEEVTGALTRFADHATGIALRAALGTEIRRGKLPGATEADLETAGGMVAFAMGKQGAYELNYSSDIDLICLFDESRYDPSDYMEARTSFVRATRKMAASLNDLTGDGYVFRTDLRLRPDPSVTPVCLAMEAAERYYESLGRTWERAAWIKARPAVGDIKAGEAFQSMMRPFVWRKHLDFAAIQDAHDMRLRIREHKGLGGALSLPGHNMKLGRGGIREIEFFTQTRQLIAGGRDPELRVRGTVEGLQCLAAKGWVPEDAAKTLIAHYREHREIEHRLQMVNDAQTHALPTTPEGMARIAAFMDCDLADFEKRLKGRLEEVHALTEDFFSPDGRTPAKAPEPEVEFDPEITGQWRNYPALRSARATEIFKRLLPSILERLSKTARPHEALLAFDGFLKGLPAGVQLFSLFDINPQLIDLLIDIVGTSPALSAHLSRNAGVFDAVIGGSFFAYWPGVEPLAEELGRVLARESDYEKKLDMARRWAKEWHFRVGVHHLRGLIDARTSGAEYAELAEAALRVLWPVVIEHFASKHGDMPGRGAVVLGMGSLGAKRLNAASDLDLIVIYDADGVEASEGRRPLPARTYYARLTQAMVTAVSALMPEGRLYEIDMRLRPSGTQGPVATSLTSFMEYQREQAWTWEHLALTRARVVAGSEAVGADIEAFRAEILGTKHEAAKVIADVADMRDRIAAAKSPEGPWDAKIGPGRLQDIELLAQGAALMAGTLARGTSEGLEAGVAIRWINAAESARLAAAYDLCWKVQSVARLLSEKPLDPAAIGEGGCRMLLAETGEETIEGLAATLAETSRDASDIVAAAMARQPGSVE